MTGCTLESGRGTWRRGHGATIDWFSVWCWNCVEVLPCYWIVDVVVVVMIIVRVKVLIVCFPLPGLTLVEILLVKGTNAVGTLLGVVSRVLWWQRAKAHCHAAGIATRVESQVGLRWLLRQRRHGCMTMIFFASRMTRCFLDVHRWNTWV
jgi:hypothetical protein